MSFRKFAIAVVGIAGATTVLAADPNAGKNAFRQQCALCHSAEPGDLGGAQGPSLHSVFGRPAATGSDFTYTKPLKDSKLVWDHPTLDRFLASPTTVVPGSAMVIPVPKQEDRDNIIAYFSALKDGTFKEAPRPAGFGPPPGAPPAPAAPLKVKRTGRRMCRVGCIAWIWRSFPRQMTRHPHLIFPASCRSLPMRSCLCHRGSRWKFSPARACRDPVK